MTITGTRKPRSVLLIPLYIIYFFCKSLCVVFGWHFFCVLCITHTSQLLSSLGMHFHKDDRGRYLPLLPRGDPSKPRAKPEFSVVNPPPLDKKENEKDTKELHSDKGKMNEDTIGDVDEQPPAAFGVLRPPPQLKEQAKEANMSKGSTKKALRKRSAPDNPEGGLYQ